MKKKKKAHFYFWYQLATQAPTSTQTNAETLTKRKFVCILCKSLAKPYLIFHFRLFVYLLHYLYILIWIINIIPFSINETWHNHLVFATKQTQQTHLIQPEEALSAPTNALLLYFNEIERAGPQPVALKFGLMKCILLLLFIFFLFASSSSCSLFLIFVFSYLFSFILYATLLDQMWPRHYGGIFPSKRRNNACLLIYS